MASSTKEQSVFLARFADSYDRVERIGIPQSSYARHTIFYHAALPARMDGIAYVYGIQGFVLEVTITP